MWSNGACEGKSLQIQNSRISLTRVHSRIPREAPMRAHDKIHLLFGLGFDFSSKSDFDQEVVRAEGGEIK